MPSQKLELFLHGGAKPKIVTADSGEVLREVLIAAGMIERGGDDVLVFVGECEEALAEPDDIENGADAHPPADISLTLEVLEIKGHHHIHCHRCRHIAIDVNFGGKTKHRRFSPAATVGVVAQWARKKFHLDPAAASEYVLRICNTSDQPRANTHLGELSKEPKCSICFDLVKEVTPQG